MNAGWEATAEWDHAQLELLPWKYVMSW